MSDQYNKFPIPEMPPKKSRKDIKGFQQKDIKGFQQQKQQMDKLPLTFETTDNVTAQERRYLNSRIAVLTTLDVVCIAIEKEVEKHGLDKVHPMIVLAYGEISRTMELLEADKEKL